MAVKRLKRPRDPLQLGKLIVDIATGQVEDRVEDRRNPHAVALRFDSRDDASDFVRHLVEDANRWVSTHDLGNIVERYKDGELEVVLYLSVLPYDRVYDLVFFSVPFGSGDLNGRSDDMETVNAHSAANRPDRREHSVLVGYGEAVHDPEKVIPSAVRLERHQERTDFRRQILASASYYAVK